MHILFNIHHIYIFTIIKQNQIIIVIFKYIITNLTHRVYHLFKIVSIQEIIRYSFDILTFLLFQ